VGRHDRGESVGARSRVAQEDAAVSRRAAVHAPTVGQDRGRGGEGPVPDAVATEFGVRSEQGHATTVVPERLTPESRSSDRSASTGPGRR
jgi:hypothetical protein